MSSSTEMKRVITHAAHQLHAAIEVEAKQHHRGQTIAAMALAEGVLLLLASYLKVTEQPAVAPSPSTRSKADHVATARSMGELIGQALKQDGITQCRFAAANGTSEKHLSQVIKGVAHANPNTLDQWAAALNRRFSVELIATTETTS